MAFLHPLSPHKGPTPSAMTTTCQAQFSERDLSGGRDHGSFIFAAHTLPLGHSPNSHNSGFHKAGAQ